MRKQHFLSLFGIVFAVCFSLLARGQTTNPISGNTTVCEGTYHSYTITPTPDVMYQWGINSNGTITGSNNSSANVYWGINGTGILTVAGYDTNNTLVETDTLSVTILPSPTPYITTNARVACQKLGDTAMDDGGSTLPIFDDSGCIRMCAYSCVVFYANGAAGSTYNWTASGAVSINPLAPDGDSVEICWGAQGFGSVTLEETTVDGCIGTRTLCIEIIESPIAHFVALPDTTNRNLHICDSTEVIFLDKSYAGGSPIVSWRWDFGDGTYSNAPGGYLTPIKHMFVTAGGMPTIYTVTLTVTNACGCSTTETMEVHVDPNQRLKIDCPKVVCENDVDTYYINRPCPMGTPNPWTVIGGTMGFADETMVEVTWDNPGPDGFGYVMYDAGLCGDPCGFAVAKVPIVMLRGTIIGEVIVCPNSQYMYRLPQWPTTTFNWAVSSSTGAFLSTTDQRNEIVVNTVNPGVLTLTCDYYNTLLKCGGRARLTINVLDPEEIVGPDKACLNTNVVYTLLNGSTGDWELLKPDLSVQTNTGSSINGLFDQVGIYTLSVTGTTFCPPDPLYIKVDPLPPPPDMIIGPDSFCKGVEMKFIAEYDLDGTIFNWSMLNGSVNAASGKESFIKMDPASSGPFVISCWRETRDEPFCRSSEITDTVYPVHVVHQVTGPTPVCPSTYHNYSQIYTSGETYEWSIFPETYGSVTSGDGTPNVQVLWNKQTGTAGVICKLRRCFIEYSDTLWVNIGLFPTPAFVSPPTDVCDSSEFFLTLTPPNSDVIWNMDDGTGDHNGGSTFGYMYNFKNNTTHVVNIRAIVTSRGGCSNQGPDTLTTSINVQPMPRVQIDHWGTNGIFDTCGMPLLTAVTAAGSIIPSTYQWYKDGTLIPGATAMTYTPTGYGKFSVIVAGPAPYNCTFYSDTLLLRSNCPCTLSISASANITGATNTNCQQYTFTSTHSSTGFIPGTTAWYRTNDGGKTITQFSSGEFGAVGGFGMGPYQVTYCATFTDGTDTCTRCNTTIIDIPYQTGMIVTHDCSSSGGGRGTTISAEHVPAPGTNCEFFVDFVSVQSGSSTSYYGHITPGAHTLQLVYSKAGYANCTTTVNYTVPDFPVAAFTFQRAITCEKEAAVVFTNTSTPNPPQMKADWDFDDGAGNNQYDVFRVFEDGVIQPIKNVLLKVTDEYGCWDTVTHAVEIIGDRLEGAIDINPTHPCKGTPAQLDYTPTTYPHNPDNYTWYSDLVQIAYTTYKPIYVFESGYYWMHGEDQYGCVVNTNADTVVVTQVPQPYITGDADQCEEVEYTLNGYVGSDPNISYEWYLGAGLVGTGATLTDKQSTAGMYTYTLVITVAKPTGGTCTATSPPFVVTVHANPAPPVPGFTITDCPTYEVELTASAGGPGTFNWSNGQSGSPAYAYAGGKYQVTYTDQYGCISKNVIDVPKDPKVYLWIFPDGCWSICPDSLYTIVGPIWTFTQWQYLKNGAPVWGGSGIPWDYTNLNIDAPGTFNLYLDNGWCNATSENMYVTDNGCAEGKQGTAIARDGDNTHVQAGPLDLVIAPNPAGNSTNIHYTWSGAGGHRYLEVYDLTGRLMERQAATSDKGTWKLGLERFVPGIYQVVMKQEGQILLNTKLSIIK